MFKAYKYRLYPDRLQELRFLQNAGAVRWVYNMALERSVKHYQQTSERFSVKQLNALLPGLKIQPETAWLAEANAQSLQGAVQHLDQAYNNFFRKLAKFPKFKNRHRDLPRFTCYQSTKIDLAQKTIQLVKHGKIKIALDRRHWTGRITSATVSQNARKQWFVSVLVEDGQTAIRPPEKITDLRGIDLGLNDLIVTSASGSYDGKRIKVKAPKFHKLELKRLRYAQRMFSRRKKDSKRKLKAKHRVAVVYGRIADRRKDFHHKLSRRLVSESQGLAFEDLNVSGMQKNRRLARSISDAGWSMLVEFCRYKSAWAGKPFVQIGRFEPSSRLCTCGKINRALQLSERTWTCACGATHDRDELAADNIRRMALHPQVFLRAGSPELTLGETA